MGEAAPQYLVDNQPVTITAMNLVLIQELIRNLPAASDDGARGIRAGLRGLGFRIENFKTGGARFSLDDLQATIDSEQLRLKVC